MIYPLTILILRIHTARSTVFTYTHRRTLYPVGIGSGTITRNAMFRVSPSSFSSLYAFLLRRYLRCAWGSLARLSFL